MPMYNQERRPWALVSFAVHIIVVLVLLLLTKATPPTIIKYPPHEPVIYVAVPLPKLGNRSVHALHLPAPHLQAEMPHQSASIPHHVAKVHLAEFDRPGVVEPVRNRSTDEVRAGIWDTAPRAASATTPRGSVRLTGFDGSGSESMGESNSIHALRAGARARLLARPTPEYTDEARNLHITGDVVLEVILGATGTVHVVRVLSGLGHGLDEAAITAVNHTRCQPATEAGGRPVDISATIRVRFQLA
jgi:TonB family protein